ncbi:MAG: hypothetical protein ACRDJ3_11780 [Solirubrobacteraceae bacterium]
MFWPGTTTGSGEASYRRIVFRSLEIDFDAHAMRAELLDGSVVREPMPGKMQTKSALRRSKINIEPQTLILTLDDDETLE